MREAHVRTLPLPVFRPLGAVLPLRLDKRGVCGCPAAAARCPALKSPGTEPSFPRTAVLALVGTLSLSGVAMG